MSDHPRQTIRAAVLALFEDEAAFATKEKSRLHNFQPADLPALEIYTLRETARRDTVPQNLLRVVSLVIYIYIKATADLDAEADRLCLIVEEKMAVKRLGGVTLSHHLAETMIDLSGEGERRIGLARLTYEVAYRTTRAGAPA